MRFFRNPLWSRLAKVGLPFFRSDARRPAWLALSLLIGLLLTVNGLNVLNSYVGRDMMTALEERYEARFYTLAVALIGVFGSSTLVEVFARYVEQRLGILWRDWLTRCFLDRYLGDRTYCRLAEQAHIDNPDQRISEDVKTFTASSLSFVILLFNAAVTFVAFASVLWSITPWLFLVAVAYAAAGTLGTILLGRRLVPLDNLQLKKEADFRFALVRVREHCGEVAQLGGEADEKARLTGRLAALVSNFRSVIIVSRNLGFFTTAYDYLPQIIPALLVAPLYIHGGVTFGTVTQAAMAFSQLLGAFSLVVRKFQDLSAYAAVVGRLGSLWEAVEPERPAKEAPVEGVPSPRPAAPAVAHASPQVEVVPNGNHVAYEALTLRTPVDHRVLVDRLTLDEPQGKRLLITGPAGSGKTALLQATAGLWQEGDGRIILPGSVMFVPQHPYTAAGRLRDVLLYGISRCDITDDRVWEALKEVGLEEAVACHGGLDGEREWGQVLSWGEKRALAVCRVLLARPRFAFLDDTAEALDTPRLERLYEALARSSITYVSVGVHPALNAFHDLRLVLRGNGKWQVEETNGG